MRSEAEADQRACPGCRDVMRPLPVPHPSRSLVSDGRVLDQPLRKASCQSCGLATHVLAPTDELFNQFYNADYDLGVDIGKAETKRAVAYSRLLRNLVSSIPSRVLEIGSGRGLVLEDLARHWHGTEFCGLEAAAQLARSSGQTQITIVHGLIEQASDTIGKFDFIFAINVIEHARDPLRFLRAIAARLQANGRCIVVCPAASPPNLELMFVDHITTFSRSALEHCASAAGLSVVAQPIPDPSIGDFQVAVLASDERGVVGRHSSLDPGLNGQMLLQERLKVLDQWRRLDAELCALMSRHERIAAFGAGEAAALVRAYAPTAWSRLERLFIDGDQFARGLGKPVERYPGAIAANDMALLIATHPRSQPAVAARLHGDGFNVIRWDHLIAR